MLYDSDGQGLSYEEDTTALVGAILTCAQQHGGAAPATSPGN